MRLRSSIPVVLLTCIIAGCSSSSPATRETTATTTPSASSSALRAIADRCGDPAVGAKVFWFSAADGTQLDGAIVGSGTKAIVLLHEYPADLCGWWPFAVSIARHGYRVLLFDFRCYGRSTCPRALRGRYLDDVQGAVALMRREGAKNVALIGASLGGTVSLMAAATLKPRIDAVVSVSGEPSLIYISGTPELDTTTYLPRLVAPALFLVSKGDTTVSVEDTRSMYRSTAAKVKAIHVFESGFAHGWSMFVGADPGATEPGKLILAFLARNLR
jgi:pimeloyl-ACP methyl ester carboxylesterase